MALQKLVHRLGDKPPKEWLSPISIPVVIFAFSDWRRKADCDEMMRVIQALAAEPKYARTVSFYWFDPDESGTIFRDLSFIDTPCVVVIKDGKEIVRFTSASSKCAMTHHLDHLLDPVRNHPTKPTQPSASEVSPHR